MIRAISVFLDIIETLGPDESIEIRRDGEMETIVVTVSAMSVRRIPPNRLLPIAHKESCTMERDAIEDLTDPTHAAARQLEAMLANVRAQAVASAAMLLDA